MIAKKLRRKTVLFAVNQNLLDNFLLALLKHQEEREIEAKDQINFIRITKTNLALNVHPKL